METTEFPDAVFKGLVVEEITVKENDDFRQELAEASRMKGLLVSMNQENEDAVFRGISRSISEMEPDSIELKILDSLSEHVPENKVIYKEKKNWLGAEHAAP